MEATNLRVVKNGVFEQISVPSFFDAQILKIQHAKSINIPSELVQINIEYDDIKNSGICTPIGPENYKYIISDFKHDSEVMLSKFTKLYKDNNTEEQKKEIDNLKEKYSIIDNNSFVNYLARVFQDDRSMKILIPLKLVSDYLHTKPSETFSLKEKLLHDDEAINNIEKTIKFISEKSSSYKNTEIYILQTDIDLFLLLEDTDISELFNLLKTSIELPFASYNSFFKILKGIEVPDDWVEIKSDNSIIFYMLNTNNENVSLSIKSEYYTRIIVNEIEEESSQNGYTKFRINIVSRLHDGLNEKELIQRIIKCLPKPPINCSYKQNEIVAEYFLDIKENNFYEQMFSDFIMMSTDEKSSLISNILVSDESDIIMRQKGGLFIYFRTNKFSDFEDFVSININQIKVKPYEHKLYPNILKIDDNALHIKLKGIPDLQKARGVQKILDRVISFYIDERQDDVVEEYEKWIEDIQEILDSQKTTDEYEVKEFLKYQAPDIFTGKYASKCSGREPTLITESEALNSSGDIFKFPQFGEGPPRYFRSEHTSYPYVGLLHNDSEDAKYPFYPCCFGTDQKNDPKTLRYKYENNIQEEEKTIKKYKKSNKRIEIFTSPQAMEDNIVAILNPKIKNTLEILNTSNYYKIKSEHPAYLRMGSIKSPNNVLDCIIKSILQYNSLNKESVNRSLDRLRVPLNYETISPKERINVLKKVREELQKFIKTNMTSQSTYSYELDALQSYLQNEDNYLDIKMFWNILEHAFDIKLFLFQKPIDENNSCLTTPIYTQNYLRRTNNNDLVIVLLEHLGVKNIRLSYPQIENIVFNEFKDKDEEFAYNPKLWLSRSYDTDRALIDNLSELMNDILNYNGSVNRPVDIRFKNTIISQWADSYGKIRLLQFQNLCILSDPIPPFESPQINSITRCNYKPCSHEEAINFLKSEDVQNYKYNIIGDIVVGIIFSKSVKYSCEQFINNIDGIRLYIPIVPQTRASLGIIDESINNDELISPSFIGKTSIIESYNKFIKISKYLKEYTLWLFSKWLYNNNIDRKDVDEDVLYKFADQGFIINSKIEYPPRIGRDFRDNIDNMISNGKIIVQNIQIRNRLMYNLNLEFSRNSVDIVNYRNRKIIKNFYIDANDFIQHSSYIVIYGLHMLKAYMTSRVPPNYIINSRIIPGYDSYFLQLNNNLRIKYLAQPAKNLEHALYICSVWNEEKYNPGYYSIGTLSRVRHTLYAYNDFIDFSDFNEPEEIEVMGLETEGEYSVLTYKQNNDLYYVALLPFIEC